MHLVFFVVNTLIDLKRTNRERMLAGEPYNPFDRTLRAERQKARQLLSRLNGLTGAEQAELKEVISQLLGKTGKQIWIEPPFFCDYGSNIELGDRVFINFNCTILDPARVLIGSRCMLGPNVQIFTASHPLDREERAKGTETAHEVRIGDDVWIGGAAVILPGVTIGSGSVIGAGSVVTKDIPENVFAAGNPCKVVKELTDGTE